MKNNWTKWKTDCKAKQQVKFTKLKKVSEKIEKKEKGEFDEDEKR